MVFWWCLSEYIEFLSSFSPVLFLCTVLALAALQLKSEKKTSSSGAEVPSLSSLVLTTPQHNIWIVMFATQILSELFPLLGSQYLSVMTISFPWISFSSFNSLLGIEVVHSFICRDRIIFGPLIEAFLGIPFSIPAPLPLSCWKSLEILESLVNHICPSCMAAGNNSGQCLLQTPSEH